MRRRRKAAAVAGHRTGAGGRKGKKFPAAISPRGVEFPFFRPIFHSSHFQICSQEFSLRIFFLLLPTIFFSRTIGKITDGSREALEKSERFERHFAGEHD